MSSATTQRAGRAPKDKNKAQTTHTSSKTAPSEGSKASDGIVSKIQVIIFIYFNFICIIVYK